MENLSRNRTPLDLAIIGGGPAGTAAALEARRRGLRVGIWERDPFPRHKVCGEFISAEALGWLRRQIPQTVQRGSVIREAEFVCENGRARRFALPRAALGLSRFLLDRALWDAALKAGVLAHEGQSVRAVRKRGDSPTGEVWELEAAEGSISTARRLIIACGRWWNLEGVPSPARQQQAAGSGKWVGAKAHFTGLESRGRVEMYLFRGGYCGLAPVEDGRTNVCCLVRRERLRDLGIRDAQNLAVWLAQVSGHGKLQARIERACQVSATVTTAPVRLAQGSPAAEGALLVGDASGFLDPFTGEGVSKALNGGRLGGRVITESLAAGRNSEQTTEIYRRKLERAVDRSYKTAALARAMFQAPSWAQNLLATPLPWLGSWLFSQTRWRTLTEDEAA